MNNVVYTQNRIIRKDQSCAPIELFFLRKARATFVEFGAPVYATTPQQGRGKMEPHAELMQFLSVDDTAKRFRLWNGSKVVVSRNIRPRENLTINYSEPLRQTAILKDISEDKDDENPIDSDETLENQTPAPRRSKRLLDKQIASAKSTAHSHSSDEPKTYKQALKSFEKLHWLRAMNEEIQSLQETGTYELTDLPNGRKPIGCKWVFKKKPEADGVRYKARLVAKGFSQKYGEDYDEVFAPVARAPTIRLLLSMAEKMKLHVRQFDVKTAFLNGNLEEEIYMTQPEGFEIGTQVLRLRKSLYGLKQAAHSWDIMLKNCLERNGFEQSEADDCLFIKKRNNDICYIVVHVDDMLFASSSLSMIDSIADNLAKDFTLKNLGPVKHFLGVDIHIAQNGLISINQQKYNTKMVNELGLEQAKGHQYPLQPDYYRLECEDLLESNKDYRKVIGMLLYVSTNTRPDVSASVNILAQRVEKPRQLDMQEALRVVKYLATTQNHDSQQHFASQQP